MDGEKPVIEQIQDSIPSGEDMKNTVYDGVDGVGSSLTDMKQSIRDSLEDFSNTSVSEASNDFLTSNSLLAKFSFILLVVIIFMIVLKIMISILGYFLTPSSNPYIIKGALNGNDKVIVPQDPSNLESAPVLKSNDRHRGVEFTWSVWLFLNTASTASTPQNIFVKGNENFDATTGLNLMNGPGLYVEKIDTADSADNTQYNLVLMMDHNGGQETSGNNNGRDKITVESIPIRKWVHVAVRLQNTLLDVYVNGTIAKRHNMLNAPKQNFNDVTVCGNTGFPGKLADLRYYSYAMNVFEINNVVMFGPNTRPSDLSIDSRAKTGTYSYLSNMWYSDKY